MSDASRGVPCVRKMHLLVNTVFSLVSMCFLSVYFGGPATKPKRVEEVFPLLQSFFRDHLIYPEKSLPIFSYLAALPISWVFSKVSRRLIVVRFSVWTLPFLVL